ncbi:MAG: hypothetical protein N2517_04730 [Ignavibacteria bacterium]|nr:hypothetical protein [Ignavibacteria bacterium]
MKRLTIIGILFAFVFYYIQSQAQETDTKGKEIFIEAKCNTCHALSSQQIEAKSKAQKDKAGDISEMKIEFETDFLIKYLKKEVEINKKKHPVAFKGSDEDLKILVDFIKQNAKREGEENKDTQQNTEGQK